MRAAMDRHGIEWTHQYADNSFALLNREEAEYQLADRIFVLSEWVRQSFCDRGLGDKTVRFSSQVSELFRWPYHDWSHKPNAFTVVAIGQTGLRKGTLDLLEGWRRFWEKRPRSRLILTGLPEHGSTPALHERLLAEYKRTNGLDYLGWVDMTAMPTIYARAHAFVSCSVEEGSTMPGVEAAMSGLPIIATPNSGIDLLVHNSTGLTILPNDPEDLAETLEEAYGLWQCGRLQQMGKTARQHAEQCDVANFADGAAQALRTVLEKWS
jgi:glycosyltransferase involved in cell wall biosynthesis